MATTKTALVTGAARGIGLAIAEKLHGQGWRVAMLDIDGPALAKSATRLEGALAIEADVGDPDQVESARQRLAGDFGNALGALVNNAGTADFGPIQQATYAGWREVMRTNLDGPFLTVQAFTSMLANAQGAVVNITSISGQRASTLRVAYGTSKAALAHLTQQQAVELAGLGVRVNAVAPGPVNTAMAEKVHTPEIRAAYRDAIPLARYGLEAEIASAAAFLLSGEASYITGHVLAVDGGFSAAGVGLPALRGES